MKVWFDSVETILGLYQTKVGFTMGLQCEWRPNWVFTCRLKWALQYDTKHRLFLSSFKYEGLIEWRSKWPLQGLNECRSNWSFI
jgi:hypothetical protein